MTCPSLTQNRWKALNPDKVLLGAALVAQYMGHTLRSPRNWLNVDDLEDALAPWCAFAQLTLKAGAFDYPRIEDPTNAQVIDVMLDFLRACEEASAADVIKIRTAMVNTADPRLLEALRGRAR